MAPSGDRNYSGTPLPHKLGIRAGSTVFVGGAPAGFSIGELPTGATVRRRAGPRMDVALLFVTRRSELVRRFVPLARAMAPSGRLWVAWPKKAARIPTDLSFETVQRHGLDAGLVDNKSVSIDHDFQGLQFVVRLADRPHR